MQTLNLALTITYQRSTGSLMSLIDRKFANLIAKIVATLMLKRRNNSGLSASVRAWLRILMRVVKLYQKMNKRSMRR